MASFWKWEKQGFVGLLQLDRPEALNALNREVLIELEEILVNQAQEDLRALVVASAHPKVFCAGADIRYMAGLKDAGAVVEFSQLGHRVFERLSRFPAWVLGFINGACLGGGFELALSCDSLWMTEQAEFGLPEVRLGLICGFGGTFKLRQRLPKGTIQELLLTGRRLKAEEAYRLGLGTRLLPSDYSWDQLIHDVNEWVAPVSPAALKMSKSLGFIYDGSPQSDWKAQEIEAFSETLLSPAGQEGLKSFIQKELPSWAALAKSRG